MANGVNVSCSSPLSVVWGRDGRVVVAVLLSTAHRIFGTALHRITIAAINRLHSPLQITAIYPNISSTGIDTHKGQVVRHKIPHKSKCCSAPRRHFSSLLSSFSVVVVSTLSSVTLIRFIITQPSVVLHRFEPLSPFSLEHLAVAPSVILALVVRFVVETTW